MNIWIVIREMSWASRLGLLVVSGFGFCAIFAPWLAPYGQSEIVGDVWEPLFGEFFFGTDQIGRDMLTMLIYGARNMIALALLTTACAFGLGSLLGFLAATMGGWVDQVLSRFVDVVISIPTLIFALIVLSSTGTSILALVTVIAIIYAMPVYRIARAVAMDIEVMDYVEAARLRGEGLWWIMRKEILPNALTPLAAEFGLRFCFVFLLISGLSFLGLGLQPPLADWGAMVRDNGGGIAWGFMHPLVPATCIALLTIGINLIVDSAVQKASGLREDH
ncbi:MAG TPA: ABC transporter permease [Gammaproteobacteria bacterium]|jgi:peptide/nickel transport system permease protein|nr:ABC transporter permease [Acidiferrobacter sp.]MEC9078994.1 ABC transporter permease [Pseudomonadota bacterium]MED5534002.1 ABC transporter permease [Pseudomonadota bacterium]HAA36441.1 ABC transporter permease [Gammaproteobacteria bacterium]|tara:strand:- start:2922 stop:3752 length:831 start_codon:yes stop_codon:yes gene_type:complete